MKAVVILKNFEGEIKHTVFGSTWAGVEDAVFELEDNVNCGKPIFDRYKTDSVTYYDNDGDEYDIYLREKVK